MPETLRGDFLLRVKGDSMIEAGILDGDVVVVRRAQDARDGEIVVALAGDDETADEATVKRFFRENGRIRLQPENAALEPIYARTSRSSARSWGCSASCERADALHRTLEQELLAVLRGASLECPVCGEFVLHEGALVRCPECSMRLHGRDRRRRDRGTIRLAGRVTAAACQAASRKVRTPQGRTLSQRGRRRKPTESGTENRPPVADLRSRGR